MDVGLAVELEKKLLSALMLNEGEAIPRATEILKPEDIYRPEHRIIYKAMQRLNSRRIPLNTLVIEQELTRTDELKKVTRPYLWQLQNYEYTTARVEYYAETLHKAAVLRRLTEIGREIADEASSERESFEAILEMAEKKIATVTTRNTSHEAERISDVLQVSFEVIRDRVNHPEQMRGVPSGFSDLDKVLNGFQATDLILLAARPSMGKTALALNIAAQAAWRKHTVAIFSLEMSKMHLGNRLLSTWSGVNSQYLNTGNMNDDDIRAVVNALDELGSLNIYIDDTAGIGLMDMRSKARRIKYEHGLDMLIIDYLQLMQGGKAENRQQEISEISRGLKALARELDVPIIALSQLSRNVEMRAEKKPQLSDLRESGSLEQDADIVMFLYRDEYYNRDDSDNENLAELIIAKNRNGPTAAVRLQFNKDILRFADLTRIVP